MSDEKIEVCFMDIFSLFSCFCSDGSFRAEHGTYREGYFPDVFQSFKRRFNIGTKVYDRVYSPPYIRDASAYYGWWRLQGDSLFLEKIEDTYGTMRSC